MFLISNKNLKRLLTLEAEYEMAQLPETDEAYNRYFDRVADETGVDPNDIDDVDTVVRARMTNYERFDVFARLNENRMYEDLLMH